MEGTWWKNTRLRLSYEFLFFFYDCSVGGQLARVGEGVDLKRFCEIRGENEERLQRTEELFVELTFTDGAFTERKIPQRGSRYPLQLGHFIFFFFKIVLRHLVK